MFLIGDVILFFEFFREVFKDEFLEFIFIFLSGEVSFLFEEFDFWVFFCVVMIFLNLFFLLEMEISFGL